ATSAEVVAWLESPAAVGLHAAIAAARPRASRERVRDGFIGFSGRAGRQPPRLAAMVPRGMGQRSLQPRPGHRCAPVTQRSRHTAGFARLDAVELSVTTGHQCVSGRCWAGGVNGIDSGETAPPEMMKLIAWSTVQSVGVIFSTGTISR